MICDESLTCQDLNLNAGHFDSFNFILVLCGESRLLISWCTCSRCDMAGSDGDLGRSRKPDVEDQRWLSTCRILGDRMIGRSSDPVCGLYYTHGDEEHVFLGWAWKSRLDGFSVCASKPKALVWWFVSQNHRYSFLVWVSKPNRLWFVGCTTKPIGGWFGVGHASRSDGLLRLEAKSC
jgi:hypothetical protein